MRNGPRHTFKKTIFQYGNYRDYLNDFYLNSKKLDKKFTFRFFAKEAGFKSCSFFKLVLQGKRNLAPDSIEKISVVLKLNKEEAYFFKNLVLMNQASTAEDKQVYAGQLIKCREYRKQHPLSEVQYRYFSQWYFVAIRELVGLPHFSEDPAWIAAQIKPAITSVQAKNAMDDLLELGLIKRDETGNLVQSDDNVATPDEVISAYLVQYHTEMIKKASESIARFNREKREISSVTFGMSKENVKKIKEIIYECRNRILELTTRDPASDAVYQLNFQLFPLAEIILGAGEDDN